MQSNIYVNVNDSWSSIQSFTDNRKTVQFQSRPQPEKQRLLKNSVSAFTTGPHKAASLRQATPASPPGKIIHPLDYASY